jgi:predicted Zn-dependent protease
VEDPPGFDERPVDVWLVPVVGFPDALAVDLLERLRRDTGLHIRISIDAGVAPGLFFADSRQMNADTALREFSRVVASLGPAKPNTTYLFLTGYDINSEDRRFRFLFARAHRPERKALVSVARMRDNPDGAGEAPILVKLRLYKMAKRQLGELYFGHTRSSDPNSVMYTPIMGLEDLDLLGTEF